MEKTIQNFIKHSPKKNFTACETSHTNRGYQVRSINEYICTRCEKKYKTKKGLVAHQKIHNDSIQATMNLFQDEKTLYACEKCDRQFRQESMLALHYKIIHENQDQKEIQSIPSKRVEVTYEQNEEVDFLTHMVKSLDLQQKQKLIDNRQRIENNKAFKNFKFEHYHYFKQESDIQNIFDSFSESISGQKRGQKIKNMLHFFLNFMNDSDSISEVNFLSKLYDSLDNSLLERFQRSQEMTNGQKQNILEEILNAFLI